MSLASGLPTPIRKLLADAELVLEAPYARRIFTNRDLAFDRITVIGFDMDYTLALYRQDELEALSIRCTLDKLLQRGYPEALREIRSDPTFAIRGLVVDKRYGNIIKMDRHGYVGRAFHGKRLLPRPERKSLYRSQRLGTERERFAPVDTLFALPEVTLFAEVVDLIDHRPELWPSGPPTYAQAWLDVRECIDQAHQDGSLKDLIQGDIGRYFQIDPELGQTLHKFRSAGKKLFLLTNSLLPYTDHVMRYVLGGQLAAYDHWRDYFDWVVVGARKPDFFTGAAAFQELDLADRPLGKPVPEPKRGRIYLGGNQQGLQTALGVHSDEVLYVGDHIYGDILRSKMHTHWRTAMVVQEMERELSQVLEHRDALDRLYGFEERRFQLDLELTAKALDGERDSALRNEARNLGREIARLSQEISDAFNPHWGMLFRDRAELSAFGAQSEDYACVYTSRVSNFRLYSPQWYFRSPRDRMAHELRV